MRKISQRLDCFDRPATVAPAKTERTLSEAELDGVAAGGGDASGGHGGNAAWRN
jgi:hypothetical protein